MKYLAWVVGIVIIAVGGYYLWHAQKNSGSAAQGAAADTNTYATSTFSVVYPSDFTADASYIYDQVNPKKPISGVKFTIPGAMATGTNLSNDSYVAVEWLPRAKNCTGDIYLAANVRPQEVAEGGIMYSVASSTGAAAGNIYDETVYALSTSSPCTAVRYFIHSGNIGNYPAPGEPGSVREFDRAALMSAFDSIRHALLPAH